MSHKSQKDLAVEYKNALSKVSVGDYYVHFKNPDNPYIIESVGFIENTEEVSVCYRALYGKGILWIRTLEDFLSEKEVDGKKVKRFQKM